jgi:hypothetical protein
VMDAFMTLGMLTTLSGTCLRKSSNPSRCGRLHAVDSRVQSVDENVCGTRSLRKSIPPKGCSIRTDADPVRPSLTVWMFHAKSFVPQPCSIPLIGISGMLYCTFQPALLLTAPNCSHREMRTNVFRQRQHQLKLEQGR